MSGTVFPASVNDARRLVSGTALVTGGGSGIGQAIAEGLAAAGAPVALLDIRPDGKLTADRIASRGGRALFLQGDVSRPGDIDAAVGAAVGQLGPLGILVNAAGILDGYEPAETMVPDLWERVIAINLTGTFLAARRALAEMLPAGRGRILNIASVAGLVGDGGGPAYVASKHGVVGLTRQLAVAGAGRGVTVNAICPGVVRTSLRATSTEILGAVAPVMRGIGGDEAAMRAVTPAGRPGTLEEIAAAALYLASEGAAYVTGQTLVIDGGWTAR
jgi:NAD(P)-dependent dehydrogenase (short-subunit alcohol dehydrogenase family)